MTKIIVTFEDDVMLKNGKTSDMQAELIRKLSEYGTVEAYPTHIAKLDAEWQKKLDNMANAYNAIAERNVDDYELALLKAHRASVSHSVQVIEVENGALKESLKKAEEKTIALANSMKATLDTYVKE